MSSLAAKNLHFLTGVFLHFITGADSVTSIGGSAFSDTKLTSVVIPNSVTSIGDDVFYNCAKLTSAIISNNITTISRGLFADCTSLTSITLPDSITSIGNNAFWGCRSLTNITIPDSVTTIGGTAFHGCTSLTSINIPNRISAIEGGTFVSCASLTSVDIPSSVTSIGEMAFWGCTALTGITIPSSVTSIHFNAFDECAALTIYSTSGSSAEAHAKEWGIPFMMGQAPAAPVTMAYTRPQSIQIDGKAVSFQTYALKDEKGNETNYVKLRDIASALNGTAAQFEVGYDGTITITTGKSYTPNGSEMSTPFSGDKDYKTNSAPIQINGEAVNLDAIVLTGGSGGYTYFKLRDLGKAIGFDVKWDSSANKIVLNTDEPYSE